ncbi:MFS general substrate transporter [Pleomassaria siparia CBS 279.74]|uniref:MFS general substrate transporter n=1 Tax=Pleomassaria siparia CBS 279.74 TaxID=1314801 RepID=A0A6G1KDW7_9PLEO|nr:MFS general substrate transporter [Pleomassaria siparia CBS 279.74]
MASSISSSSGENHHQPNPSVKASEITPLLAAVPTAPILGEEEEEEEAEEEEEHGTGGVFDEYDEDAALPKWQIFLLCLARLVEPVGFFGIVPYINQMVEDTGVLPTNVGFYSGLIESLFSATSMCVMVFWGRAADRVGRKPILALSMFGIAIATALFGMSRTIWQMIIFRCFGGLFAGTSVTIRAMITENSTKKTQAQAFSYFAFSGNLGILLGTIIGGSFESPATKFPSTFGRVQFFHDYPYAFPGFVVSFVGLVTALLSTFSLKETLHLAQANKSGAARMTSWQLMKAPGVKEVITVNNYVFFLAFSYTAVNPVFLYTAVNIGGAGFAPGHIALFLGIAGISQAFWLLVCFPPLHRRFGTGFVLRICAAAWPFFFLVLPVGNLLLRYDLRIFFWILSLTVLVVGSGVAMAFIACQLAVNDIAPSHETLGELNAIVLALSCGMRAIVPAISTSLFTIGVKYHILGGQLFWIILICIASGLWFVLKILPAKAEGIQRGDNTDEDEQA